MRGLGVDRALYGAEPDIEPEPRRRPRRGRDPLRRAHRPLAGAAGRRRSIPSVPSLDKGRVPWPSRVRADVPAELDRIAARALATTTPPKGEPSFTSIAEVVAAAVRRVGRAGRAPRAATHRSPAAARGHRPGRRRGSRGPRRARRRPDPRRGQPSAHRPPQGGDGPGRAQLHAVARRAAHRPRARSPSRSCPSWTSTRSATPARRTADQAQNAVDRDPSTAWRTVRYKAADLSGQARRRPHGRPRGAAPGVGRRAARWSATAPTSRCAPATISPRRRRSGRRCPRSPEPATPSCCGCPRP